MGYLEQQTKISDLQRGMTNTPVYLSLLDQKKQELVQAEARVERIKEVIKLLEANPELQRLLELLGSGY